MAFPTLDDDAIRLRIRRLINEPVALIHSDDSLNDYYDMGAQAMVQMTLLYEGAGDTFALVTADQSYSYADIITTPDCIRFESMLYMGSSDTVNAAAGTAGLVKIPPRLYKHLDDSATGPPKYWTDFSETIHIWPVPTASENGHLVRVFYYKMFQALTGTTDATSLPEYLREYPIWYAVAKVMEREGKYQQAQQYYSYFWNFIMFHRQDRNYKPVDSKEMMKLPDNTQFE